MDPNLHQKQGVHHLTRVLDYYPFVEEAGRATVHLTVEDWHVVADTLFNMSTPKEMLPEAIRDYRLIDDNSVIELTTDDCVVNIETI
jgi:hypothetical protein